MTSSQPQSLFVFLLVLIATTMISPIAAVLCSNEQCEFRVVYCSRLTGSLCRVTKDGVAIVPDLKIASRMCASMNMSLAAPNDAPTNAQMFKMCPSAGFFDLVAVADSPCNRFVLQSNPNRNATYFNWYAGEPNNLTHKPQACSNGTVLEGCVAFAVSAQIKTKDNPSILGSLTILFTHCSKSPVQCSVLGSIDLARRSISERKQVPRHRMQCIGV